MHEVHLMGQVVKAVDQALRKTEGGRPFVVRLKVSALSHLMSHGPSSLQSAFELASLGTLVEGASLEILIVPVAASCLRCGMRSEVRRADAGCDACGSLEVDLEEVPEVVVHEVVVTE
jgi:hydrogenase nickel incorporation protein HypA/HybF